MATPTFEEDVTTMLKAAKVELLDESEGAVPDERKTFVAAGLRVIRTLLVDFHSIAESLRTMASAPK